MEANLEALGRELAALTQRFLDLGAKLGEAARALEEAGAPPSDGLVEALAGARSQFVQLRTDVLAAAASVDVPPPPEPESLRELEPILAAVDQAIRAQARRAALEQARERVVAIIDRVLEIVHRDDPDFAALAGCHAKARDVRTGILALTDPESEDARRLTGSIQAFSDLLMMVESRDALDDERYAQLEESVSKTFGRGLAVSVARGRLAFAGDVVEEPEPPPAPAPVVVPEPAPVVVAPTIEMPPPRWEPPPAPAPPPVVPEPEPVSAAPTIEMPPLELEPREPPAPARAPEPAPAPAPARVREPAPVVAAAPVPSGPDETAQWWLAAWARWSGWKSSHQFAAVVREEVSKYPYLLSVPIQKSPEYDDGLLAYGYSILMDHVEKQSPGCVGNALNSLKAGQTRPVGEQLYDYLVAEGRLRETYAEFVKNALLAAVPDPGVWFQFRILESREDTRILQRPSPRIGDTDLSGQRLASDGQRYNEHKFKMTLPPLTARFVLVSADMKDARGIGVRLLGEGAPSEDAWVVSVPAGAKAGAKTDARRVSEEGTHVPGLGKEFGALWVAVFNPDPAADRHYDLSIFLRKDTKSPFRGGR